MGKGTPAKDHGQHRHWLPGTLPIHAGATLRDNEGPPDCARDDTVSSRSARSACPPTRCEVSCPALPACAGMRAGPARQVDGEVKSIALAQARNLSVLAARPLGFRHRGRGLALVTRQHCRGLAKSMRSRSPPSWARGRPKCDESESSIHFQRLIEGR